MGSTGKASKQRWNEEHYKQVKTVAALETIDAFKTVCAAAGQSVNGAITRYMEASVKGGLGRKPPTLRLATRPQRRMSVRAVLSALRSIRDAEADYAERIPDNFRGGERYEASEQSVDALDEAIGLLDEAYRQ
jgi:hypothetical protein